ncbi:Bardet-Biedl syndrome 5 protein-like protein, partial [Fragariocoptes setiger]
PPTSEQRIAAAGSDNNADKSQDCIVTLVLSRTERRRQLARICKFYIPQLRGPSTSNSNTSSSTVISSGSSVHSTSPLIHTPMANSKNHNNITVNGSGLKSTMRSTSPTSPMTRANIETSSRALGSLGREIKLGITDPTGLAHGSDFGLGASSQYTREINLKPDMLLESGSEWWSNKNSISVSQRQIAFESLFAILGLISKSAGTAVGDITDAIKHHAEYLEETGTKPSKSKQHHDRSDQQANGTKLTRRSSSPQSMRLSKDSKFSLVSPDGSFDGSSSDSKAGIESSGTSWKEMWRRVYCRLVCVFLWSAVVRLSLGLLLANKETRFTILVLDFYHLGPQRNYYLIPALCVAIQSATVSLLFLRYEQEPNWLVPFYSSKDHLITLRNSFKPNVSDYSQRIRSSFITIVILALITSVSLSGYTTVNALQMFNGAAGTAMTTSSGGGSASSTSAIRLSSVDLAYMRPFIAFYAVYNILWAAYSVSTCYVVSFFFNLICSIIRARFHSISRDIEELADSDASKTAQQARRITALYLEHNEACELLDESNDFWQMMIFYTYFTYIPGHCYCLYNLFFVDFEFWPNFFTWSVYIYTGFIICLVSFSASGVSAEAHAPYTSLHTLSLLQLPVDVEVNISTFLHRVRGLTIGYSCYDLFAVTNASMSNTAAACASYFLIVADFSRSSVFSNQANGTTTSNSSKEFWAGLHDVIKSTSIYQLIGKETTITMSQVDKLFSTDNSLQGYLWQERSLRFDLSQKDLALIRGEKAIGSLYPIEDIKGNLGQPGVLTVTNLRIIWQSVRQRKVSISVGLGTIVNAFPHTIRSRVTFASDLGSHASNCKTICFLSMYDSVRYEFIFDEFITPSSQTKESSSRSQIKILTGMTDNKKVTPCDLVIKVWDAYRRTTIFRTTKQRIACLIAQHNNSVNLLESESIYSKHGNVVNYHQRTSTMGAFVVTNVRLIWYALVDTRVNISLPYLAIRIVRIEDTKSGPVLVVKTNEKFRFKIEPTPKLELIHQELKHLHTIHITRPCFGPEVMPECVELMKNIETNSSDNTSSLNTSVDPANSISQATAMDAQFPVDLSNEFAIARAYQMEQSVHFDEKPIFVESFGLAMERIRGGRTLEDVWKITRS